MSTEWPTDMNGYSFDDGTGTHWAFYTGGSPTKLYISPSIYLRLTKADGSFTLQQKSGTPDPWGHYETTLTSLTETKTTSPIAPTTGQRCWQLKGDGAPVGYLIADGGNSKLSWYVSANGLDGSNDHLKQFGSLVLTYLTPGAVPAGTWWTGTDSITQVTKP